MGLGRRVKTHMEQKYDATAFLVTEQNPVASFPKGPQACSKIRGAGNLSELQPRAS